MRNEQLSDIFEEMAVIMEILGEDRFRVNTYRKVARVIGDCPKDVAVLAAEGKLQELAGVGKSSAEKINEFVHGGTIGLHRELLKKIPPGLLDMLRIPGMGPKGVKAVWEGLKVTDLDKLKKAIEDGSLEGLAGFGKKKGEAMLKGIEFIRSVGDRILLIEAEAIAEYIIGEMKEKAGVKRIVAAGSLRRGCETIGDVDLLAEGKGGGKIIEAFTGLAGVEQVLAAGETKASVRFANSELCSRAVQVDLRIVAAASMGAALQYFTGSKHHNVRLREIAIKQKLKLNEYGLFKGEKAVAGTTEEEIYEKLGLEYVEPSLREDRGEVEAALKGELPELVTLSDIRGDLHMHSPASDGREKIEKLVAAAQGKGYEYIAITDHSKSSVIANGLDVKRLRASIKKIREIDESLKDFSVLAGTEVDILTDGSLDYPDEVLAELDFVMASVHSGMKGSRERNTKRILQAMENPYVNCIGHLTGRMIQVREPMDLDIEAIIKQAQRTGTALEVSASPLRLDLKDIHCKLAVEAGVRLIINTDAHDTLGLDLMRYGVATARRGWVQKSDVLNCQPLAVLRKWVKDKRG